MREMQLIIFILAIIGTQFIISRAGCSLASIGDTGIDYAYFVFSNKRKVPMTVNILMDIFIPNVVMIFLYDLYKYYSWYEMLSQIWIFPLGFYLWRAILICIILRRRELYCLKFELINACVSSIISFIVYNFFLKTTESVFIRADELREELGFAIIVVIYEFIKMILDAHVNQTDVLKEEELKKYIERKFDIFYKRYNQTIASLECDAKKRVLIYAIMIFEDFNRGPEKRLIEYVLFPFRKKETIGIMQVESDKLIGNKGSIKKAIELINHYWVQLNLDANIEVSECDVYEVATQYNCDERYGENITYIYKTVEEYVDNNILYNEFFKSSPRKLKTVEDKTVVCCHSLNELAESIGDNTSVQMPRIDINILADLVESKHLYVEQSFRGLEVVIDGLNHVDIDWNGSQLFSSCKDVPVLRFANCMDVSISNLNLRGNIGRVEAPSPVLCFENSDDVYVSKVCVRDGTLGIQLSNTSIIMENVDVHDCCCGAIYSEGGSIEIRNCSIYSCKGAVEDLMRINSPVSILDTEIYDNIAEMSLLKTDSYYREFKNIHIYDNMFRKKYFWDEFEEEVLLENNIQLPWTDYIVNTRY